jgi:hypothetical protein
MGLQGSVGGGVGGKDADVLLGQTLELGDGEFPLLEDMKQVVG